MKIMFCGFGNPDNRGCEAIIRTVSEMTKEAFQSATTIAMSNDYGKVSMPKLSTINQYMKSYYPHDGELGTFVYYGLYKIFGGALGWCWWKNHRLYRKAGKIDLCVSIGGDNFCYNTKTDCFLIHHFHYKKEHSKLVHWGSSFEKKLMYPKLVEDLNKFDVIMVRESISYNTLKSVGIKVDIKLIPDPAFTLKRQAPKDNEKVPSGWVGLNISPMVIGKEHHAGAIRNNVVNLIDYLTEKCNEHILLIPHVCNRKTGEGDYSVMKEFLQYVKHPEMCQLIGYQYNAMELKYIISKCRLFIGARTHATIAAYSTMVPTLTIGYSVKAKGIATDLFGTDEHYVLSTQNLDSDMQMVEAFSWINEHEEEIRKKLQMVIPNYIKNAHSAVDLIKELIENE